MGEVVARTLTEADEAQAVATIVLAFAADPVARWTWPEPDLYLDTMPAFARAFGGRAFSRGGAHATGGFRGAALWLPPGVTPDDDALEALIEQTVPASSQADGAALFEQMASYHPHEPHWYLPLIGVDPAHQGRGYGNALLAHALQACDREHAAAYLESTNPRNIPLYERHGFRALGTIQGGIVAATHTDASPGALM